MPRKRRQKQTQPPQSRYRGPDKRVLLVVDVEATCEDREVDPKWVHEIIELPVVAVDTASGAVLHEFRTYVRPAERPRLTEFCTRLTGIQQADVDAAPPLRDALALLVADLQAAGLLDARGECAEHAAFAADGPWDFKHFVLPECRRLGLALPPAMHRWVDIRWSFARVLSVRRCNVRRMLGTLGMEFEGREHSGIDDSRNIARIAAALVQRGGGAPLYINDRFIEEDKGAARRGEEWWAPGDAAGAGGDL